MNILDQLTLEQKEELVRLWNEVRKRAKHSSTAMFSACIKDERTHMPVVIAPHQQLGLEFMDYHRRGVLIWPINHSKTTDGIAWALRRIYKNPSSRGAVVSATQNQAKKILKSIADYILFDPEFRSLVTDPETGEVHVLQGEKWTDSQITVRRPYGVKDPTLVAVGIDGGLPGSRLDWILVDDLLNLGNTRTQDGRDHAFTFIDSSVLSRLEADGQIFVNNSAWHPDDVLHRLEKLGWATLRMGVTGDIYIRDDAETIAKNKIFDSDLIEDWPGGDLAFGSRVKITDAAMRAYQQIVYNRFGLTPSPEPMLWNPHPTIPSVSFLKRKHPIAAEFNRLYMSQTRDDGSAMCKEEWIELCKRAGRERGYFKLPRAVTNPNNVFTGVDLAFSKKDGSDDVAIFTFEVLPPGNHRLIVDIKVGKMSGPEIRNEIIRQHHAYGGVFRVENNAAQDLLLQFMRESNVDVPIRPHTTGANKAREDFGVPSMFSEFANGMWIIPNAMNGLCEPEVQRFINECLYYNPSKHTGDILMAAWFAREQGREFGMISGGETANQGARGQSQGIGIGAAVMMR